MKRLFVTLFMTALSPLLLAGLVLAPVAEAGSASSTRTRTGSGGGSATRTRTASGSGTATTTRTATGSGGASATRTRSTSVNNVNNVNVNRHTDVNVHVDDHHSGWDDHPVAAAAAVTATVAVTAAVIGSIVYTPPPNCVPVNVGGVPYQQCGSTWYQPQYAGTQVQYVVVVAPK